jgi:probable rRNA maturation factor
MEFYLVNNTDWEVKDSFLEWLFAEISTDLKPDEPTEPWKGKSLGIVLVDEVEMASLNKQFRKKDGPTDVLSFEGSADSLGELVLCRELIFKQAEENEIHESEELSYLILHGVLHLLGYDHEAPASDAEKMFAIQDKIFALLQEKDILDRWKNAV